MAAGLIDNAGFSTVQGSSVYVYLKAANDVVLATNAGAPSNGTSGTLAAIAGPGSVLTDYTNGVLYINTNTLASPTWTKVGTQS